MLDSDERRPSIRLPPRGDRSGVTEVFGLTSSSSGIVRTLCTDRGVAEPTLAPPGSEARRVKGRSLNDTAIVRTMSELCVNKEERPQ